MNWIDLLQDALFAAIAAIGFACISRPPSGAYWCCAVLAAVGHSLRYMLINSPSFGFHIVPATLVASLLVGVMAVFLSPRVKCPAETCLFPALLPMIPGIYAYKSVAGLAMCVLHDSTDEFDRYYSLFTFNGLTCLSILFVMVVGATVPIFVFKRVSFSATR
ncbi:MAG: threonine/serine exporter family protein [Muribaculaceae bacterium]|nr:threonine/serine exporter family protein [Muribaculaceae bacterium]